MGKVYEVLKRVWAGSYEFIDMGLAFSVWGCCGR